MRQNKEFSIIALKKYEEPELHLHCAQHPGCRMVRMATGLRCQICGGVNIVTRNITSRQTHTQTIDPDHEII